MELKYILDDIGNFALFSPVNSHRDMARGFYRHPVSAGFCRILVATKTDGRDELSTVVECYGNSVSLHLESGEYDGSIITAKLNNKYE